MKQAVLLNFDMPWLPLTGLLIFVVCFSAYCWWVMEKKRVPYFEHMSQMPIQDSGEKYE
jgi:hypothetical protein